MKRVYLILLLITFSFITKAQVQVHVGATTACNATFVLDKGLSKDPRYVSDYTYKFSPIGMSFGIDFSRKFGLSLEGIMSSQGQIYKIIDAAEKIQGERKIDLNYINLPLLMKFMSGGNSAARANFNIGPQLSFLTDAVESVQANAGVYTMPEGISIESVQQEFPSAIDNGDGTYTLPADVPSKSVLTKKANDFKNSEFQIAAAFGLDVDLSRRFFLTTQIRANYSLTDMRNGDVVEVVRNGGSGGLFGQRANLVVGVQLGVHYMFGITRSFKFKE